MVILPGYENSTGCKASRDGGRDGGRWVKLTFFVILGIEIPKGQEDLAEVIRCMIGGVGLLLKLSEDGARVASSK